MADKVSDYLREIVKIEDFRQHLRGVLILAVDEAKSGEWSFMIDELTDEELKRLQSHVVFRSGGSNNHDNTIH